MQSDISGRSPAALTHVMMSAVLKTSTEVVSAYAKRAPRMAARRQDPVCSGDFGLRPRNWVVEAMRLIYGRPFTSSAGKCHAWKWATGETVWHTVVLHAEDVCGVGTCHCLERTGVAYSVFRGLVAVSAKVLCSGGAMDLE